VSDELLVYGAYGYTGKLVAERATEAGLSPILAGRDADAVRAVGARLDQPVRRFGVDEAAADPARHLGGVDVLLNCAGPFDRTADPLVDACLATETDYLDVTGEIPVFVALHRRTEAARAAGVTLLPGVGFDVVPTDCLAAHLVERLPDADALALGFESHGGISPGTARTVVEGLGEDGAVRVDGRIRAESVGARRRLIDFGTGERTAVSIPWGDVATAHWTTGAEEVVTYVPLPTGARRVLEVADTLAPVLSAAPVRRGLSALVGRVVTGPDEADRRTSRAFVWGEARRSDDGNGRRAVSRLETPGTYALTAATAVESARRVLRGDVAPGYRTPAGAFGPGFVLDIDGVEGFEDS
jgi:short subunit dehydrogenase-like uncharacterized protein